MPFKWILKLKPEMNTSLEQIIVGKWGDPDVMCLVKHVHIK